MCFSYSHYKRMNPNGSSKMTGSGRASTSASFGIKLAPLSAILPSAPKPRSKSVDSTQMMMTPSSSITDSGLLLSPEELLQVNDKFSDDSGIVSVNSSFPTTPSPPSSASANHCFSSSNKLPYIGSSTISLQYPPPSSSSQSLLSTTRKDAPKNPPSTSAKKRQQFRQLGERKKLVEAPGSAVHRSNDFSSSALSKEILSPTLMSGANTESMHNNMTRRNTVPAMLAENGTYKV